MRPEPSRPRPEPSRPRPRPEASRLRPRPSKIGLETETGLDFLTSLQDSGGLITLFPGSDAYDRGPTSPKKSSQLFTVASPTSSTVSWKFTCDYFKNAAHKPTNQQTKKVSTNEVDVTSDTPFASLGVSHFVDADVNNNSIRLYHVCCDEARDPSRNNQNICALCK